MKIVDKVRVAIKAGKVKTADDLRAQLKVRKEERISKGREAIEENCMPLESPVSSEASS